MTCYKVSNLNNVVIGIATSADLRKASKKNKMLCCLEDQAQYVSVNDKIYRIGWLNKEKDELRGKFPLALMMPIAEEEYYRLHKQYQ